MTEAIAVEGITELQELRRMHLHAERRRGLPQISLLSHSAIHTPGLQRFEGLLHRTARLENQDSGVDVQMSRPLCDFPVLTLDAVSPLKRLPDPPNGPELKIASKNKGLTIPRQRPMLTARDNRPGNKRGMQRQGAQQHPGFRQGWQSSLMHRATLMHRHNMIERLNGTQTADPKQEASGERLLCCTSPGLAWP